MTKKRGRLSTVLILALISAVLFAVLILPPIHREANYQIEKAVNQAVNLVYEATSLRLGYEYVMFTGIDHVSLHGLELFQEETSQYAVSRRKVASIKQLDFIFNPFAALFGRTSGILKEIVAEGSVIELFLEKDISIYNRLSAYLAKQAEQPSPRLSVLLKDTDIVVHAGLVDVFHVNSSAVQISTKAGAPEISSPLIKADIRLSSIGLDTVFVDIFSISSQLAADFSSSHYQATADIAYRGISVRNLAIEADQGTGGVHCKVSPSDSLIIAGNYDFKDLVGFSIQMANYIPSADVAGTEGLLKELLGLRYEGNIRGGYHAGSAGKGLWYSGEISARGAKGQKIDGVDVSDALAKIAGKGDGTGFSGEAIARQNGYEARYNGKIAYRELELGGKITLKGKDLLAEGLINGKSGNYSLKAGGEYSSGKEKLSFSADAVLKNAESYELKELKLGYGKEEVTGRGRGKLGGGLGFEGVIGYKGQEYEVSVGYGQGVVKFSGSHGLFGEVALEKGVVKGKVQAEGLPVVLGEGVGRFGFDAEFRYGGAGDWEVQGKGLKVGYEGLQAVPEVMIEGYKADGKGFTVKRAAVSGKGYEVIGLVSGVYGQGGVTVQGSLTGKGQVMGNGARYEVRVSYGEGFGKVRVGVLGYEAAEGLVVNGYVEAQGGLDLAKVMSGEYGELLTWRGEGQAGLVGKGYEVREQKFGIEGFKEGGREGVAIQLKGGGYSGTLAAGFDGQMRGEITLREFVPGTVVTAEAGVLKELGVLRYTGVVRAGMSGGESGVKTGTSGMWYEGDVTVQGAAGDLVFGVDVSETEVKLAGKGDSAGVRGEAVVRRGEAEARYEGVVRYEALELGGALRVKGKGFEGAFDIAGKSGKYTAQGSVQAKAGAAWGIKAQVTEQADRYDIGLEAGFGKGRLEAAGSYGKEKGWYEAQLKAEGVGIEEIRKLFELAGVGDAGLLAGVDGGTVSVEGSLQGQGKKVSWVIGKAEASGSMKGTSVRISGKGIVGDEQSYELKELKLGYGKEEVTGRGRGKLGGGLGFEGVIGYKGQEYEVSVGYGQGVVKFSGSHGLFGEVALEKGVVKGKVQAEGLPVVLGEGVGRFGFDAEFRYGGAGDWEVQGKGLKVGYEGLQAVPEVMIEGYKADGKGFELAKIAIQSGTDIYDGTLRGSYKNNSMDELLQIEASFKNRSRVAERASLSYKNENNQLEALLKLENIDLDKYLPSLKIKGLAYGKIEAKGFFSLAALTQAIRDKQDLWAILPPATFEFDMKNGELQNAPVNLAGNGTFEGGNLLLNIPVLEIMRSKITKANLYLQIPTGNFALDSHLETNLASSLLETDLGVSGQAIFSTAEGFALQSIKMAGNLKNMQYHETSILPWAFSGSYQNGNLNFQGGKGAVSLSMLADGTFDMQLEKDLPILGRLRGILSPDGTVNANIENLQADLKSLGKYLSTKTFDIRQGIAKGNLTIKGSLEDPEIFGELTMTDAAVYSRELVQGLIGPFFAKVVINGKNIETMPTEIPLEQGKVTVAATGLFDRWSITDLRFNVSTKPDSIIALSGKIAGITVIDAKAKVDLTLSLNDELVIAEGKLYLEKGQILIDPQGFLPENAPPVDENALAFRVKLAMTFGKQLEVFIPDNKIPLVKGFTNPSSFLSLQYDSNSQDFSLDGKVDLRTGYVLYYFRNFFLKSGVIEFAENSTKFNPLITAIAELRESTLTGPVKITLSAEKSPLENLNPRLTSVPFMTETQLIALMSGGVLALDTSKPLDIREAAIASSEFLPQFNIFKTFEQTVRKALGLDIVYIRSSFIQRWLLDLTKPATEPATEDPLARYLDKSELYMGKYLTDSAFLYAALKFTENPLVSSSRLRLDSEFGIELDAPFGILDWSITPSLSEGSLVTGQKLSLSWQFQY